MTATNDALRQASAEAVGGTTLDYNSDFLAMFDALSTPGTTFNERMINYVNAHIGGTYTDINSALAAFAASEGVATYNSLGTFASNTPWILATGVWNNLGIWLDSATWTEWLINGGVWANIGVWADSLTWQDS